MRRSVIAAFLALLIAAWSHGSIPGSLTAPVNLAVPSLSGTLTVGQVITSTTGSWNNCVPSCTYQYTFYHEGSVVSGPSSTNTYTLAIGDMSDRMSVSVVATNSIGASPSATSIISSPVISTTAFYVSSSGGSDSNSGTDSGHPWQHLAKISSYSNSPGFSAGTSILLKAGDTWDWASDPAGPVIFLNNGGSAPGGAGTGPIVIDSYGAGANPVVDGSILKSQTTDWQATGTTNVWQSVVQFLPPLNQNASISSSCQVTITSGSSPVGNGQSIIFGGTLPGVIVPNQTYYVTGLSGNVFNFSATFGGGNVSGCGGTFNSATVGITGLPYFAANDAANILWGFSTLGGSFPAAVQNASFGTMTGGDPTTNNVWYKPGDGTAHLVSQGQWNFNTDNFRVQIYSTSNPAAAFTGLRVVLDSGFLVMGGAAGANNWVGAQNITIQNAGASNAFKTLGSNMTFRDLVIQWFGGGNIGGGSGVGSRAGDGFDFEGVYNNMMVERVVFFQMYDNAVAPQLFTAGSHDNMTVRNCIAFHFDKFVELEPTALTGSTVNGVNIYNNTAYGVNSWSDNQRPNNAFGTWIFENFVGNPINITLSNFDMRNNVGAGAITFGQVLHTPLLFDLTDWQTSRVEDYNLWKATSGNVEIAAANAACLSASNPNMSTWASACGFEAHGLIDTDPQFTSNTNNFTPTSGSPLRNAGVNLTSKGVVWDINRNPRPATGNFTIGAIQ